MDRVEKKNQSMLLLLSESQNTIQMLSHQSECAKKPKHMHTHTYTYTNK